MGQAQINEGFLGTDSIGKSERLLIKVWTSFDVGLLEIFSKYSIIDFAVGATLDLEGRK